LPAAHTVPPGLEPTFPRPLTAPGTASSRQVLPFRTMLSVVVLPVFWLT